jgi:LPXTG-motif cell wall-anchored protein
VFGDLYLDTVNGDVYIKSAEADGWEWVVNLQGPQGPPGEDGEDGQDGQDGEDGKDGKCECDEEAAGSDDSEEGSDEEENGDENGSDNSGDKGGDLPDTATSNPLFMLIGSLMAVAGGALVFIRKKVLG